MRRLRATGQVRRTGPAIADGGAVGDEVTLRVGRSALRRLSTPIGLATAATDLRLIARAALQDLTAAVRQLPAVCARQFTVGGCATAPADHASSAAGLGADARALEGATAAVVQRRARPVCLHASQLAATAEERCAAAAARLRRLAPAIQLAATSVVQRAAASAEVGAGVRCAGSAADARRSAAAAGRTILVPHTTKRGVLRELRAAGEHAEEKHTDGVLDLQAGSYSGRCW